jgi:hypothetical protein
MFCSVQPKVQDPLLFGGVRYSEQLEQIILEAHAELTRLARDKSATCADNLESNPEKLRRLSEHAAPEGAAMSSYRCYFVDETNHIAGVHFVECATDGLAQARADELLVHSVHPAMEVWDGARFVYVAKQRRGRPSLN